MKIQSINPRTGKGIKTFPSITPKELRNAISGAKLAQVDWASRSKEERIAIILKLKDIIEREKDNIVDLVFEEAGMPKEETTAEIVDDILVGIDGFIEDYKNVSELDYSDEVFDSKVEFISQGVVGHIGIWNYPVWQTMITAIPALLVGNAIVFKSSELTTLVGIKIAGMIWEAGVPKNVFSLVIGGGDIGRRIVKSDVDMIVFTGGIDTGKDIIANADIKPLLLELSGNDAGIVCSDCDLNQAIKGITFGSFLHGGQVCTKIKRIFVLKEIAEEFIKGLLKETKKLRIGKDIAPMIRAGARNKVHNQVSEAIKARGKILLDGNPVKGDGFYFEPTIILYESSKIEMFKEEIFGPVAQVQIVESEEEAIRLANDSIYGLGATVWTKDIEKANKIAAKLDVGTVWINDSNCPIPTGVYSGGVKQSGIASSQNRIMSFLKKKTIIANPKCESRMWWFPY